MAPTKSGRWDLGLRPPYPLVPDARPSCRSLRRYGERVPVRTGSSLDPLPRPSPEGFKHAISVEARGGASNQWSLGLEPQFHTLEFCNSAVCAIAIGRKNEAVRRQWLQRKDSVLKSEFFGERYPGDSFAAWKFPKQWIGVGPIGSR